MKIIQVCCACLLSTLAACGLVSQHRSAASVTDTAKSGVPAGPPTGVGAAATRVPDSRTAADAKVLLRTKQFAAALHELQLAAERGDVESEYLLGLVYANGLGTAVSELDARHWLTAAADKSYPDAARALAGLSIPPTRGAAGDPQLARELLIWAIRHRDEESMATFVKAPGARSGDDQGRVSMRRGLVRQRASSQERFDRLDVIPARRDRHRRPALIHLPGTGSINPGRLPHHGDFQTPRRTRFAQQSRNLLLPRLRAHIQHRPAIGVRAAE